MRCPKCRAELEEDAVFCTNCGIEIESYIKWSPDYKEPQKKAAVSQPTEPKKLAKPEQAESESIQMPKSKETELENFQELKPKAQRAVQESQPKKEKEFKEAKPKEEKAFKEAKPKEEKVFNEKKSKKSKNPSFDETFYQQKERFHAKEFFKKHFKAIVGAAVLFSVLIFAVSFIYDVFFGPPDNVIAVYDENDNKNIIYLNTTEVGTLEGAVQIFDNMDRSAFYIIDGKSTVWYLKGKKLVEVMKDCEHMLIANHDKTALLVNKKNLLFRYDGSELEKITEEEVRNIAISGNGAYYAYSVYKAGEYISYIGKKPNKEEKAENVRVSAISEKGEYVYGIGNGGNLICIDKKGRTETLGEDIYLPMVGSEIILNEKGTEIMFVMNKKVYISKKGKEPNEVANGTIANFYGRQTGNDSAYMYNGFMMFWPSKTLKKSVISVQKNGNIDIYLISNSYEGEKIVGGVSEFYGTDKKASIIYYKKDSVIYSAKAEKDAKEENLTGDLDIRRGYLLKDNKQIYFITEDSELGCVKENGEIEYANIKIDKRNCEIRYVGKQGVYIQTGEEFFYISRQRVRELKNVKGFFSDEASGRVYAYTRKQLYNIKNGKMKKLKGSFNKIYYIMGG